jgi:hypothetical protein
MEASSMCAKSVWCPAIKMQSVVLSSVLRQMQSR